MLHERGPLRQLAEVRGWVGGFSRPHQDVTLSTSDGVQLVGSYLSGPGSNRPATLLCHGFAAHRAKPAYALLADELSRQLPVLALDHRGHGGADGSSTLGVEESHDVTAGLSWLAERGHRDIVPIGVSMGGAAVLRALGGDTPATGAVLVSTAAYRGRVRRPGLADLDEVLRDPVRRQLWQWVAGFRFVHPREFQRHPDPIVHAIDVEVPVLLVHGEDDDYFPPSDADALADALPGPATVWHEPAGFGHAETGFTPAFAARLVAAIRTLAGTGRFPERGESISA